MKVNVVKDSSGRVVAAFEKPAPSGPQIAPQLQPEYTVHEVDASDNYKQNPMTFYENHSK
jgi:hypothetical protein